MMNLRVEESSQAFFIIILRYILIVSTSSAGGNPAVTNEALATGRWQCSPFHADTAKYISHRRRN